MNVDKALELVKKEIESARKIHGTFNSPHEGWAVIKEELDEFSKELDGAKIKGRKKVKKLFNIHLDRLWDTVTLNEKKHPERTELFLEEGVQFAAMIIRFIADFC